MTRGRYIAMVLAVASATALGGCQQKTAGIDGANSLNTASTAPVSFEATAALGKKWQADPANIPNGLAYAGALESTGQVKKQFDVYASLYAANPGNAKLAAIYGKKLAGSGRGNEAIPVLQSAANAPGADWRVYSALGTAYDQQGLYDKARANYSQALATDPERRVDVAWDVRGDFKRSVTLRVMTADRPGLLADITNTFSKKGVNISQANCRATGDDRAVNTFEVTISDLKQLTELMRSIEKLNGVHSVERI